MELAERQQRFAEWTRDHSAILHHVVNGFAAGDDRNDLLQEVLLTVWKSIPAFRGQAKASTYIYRVCHNAALLWVRSEKNYRRRVEQFSAFGRSDGHDAAEAGTDERLAQLYAAIRELKPVDRSVVLLALDGLSYRDIGEVLGISESNVGVKLTRAKAHLAQAMKGKANELQ